MMTVTDSNKKNYDPIIEKNINISESCHESCPKLKNKPSDEAPVSRKRKGSRSARRMDNLNFLLGLVDNEEYGDIDVFDLMEPSMSVFAEILSEKEKMKVWNDFINQTEEDQEEFLNNCSPQKDTVPETVAVVDDTDDLRIAHPAHSAEECFQRVDQHIRKFLRRRHVPFGALSYLEEEVSNFFTEWPTSIFISKLDNGFQRLLLHAVCQYLGLISQSVSIGNTRQTEVENKRKSFCRPGVSLTDYLENLQQQKTC